MTASSATAADADFTWVEARDVSRNYGRRRALANVTLRCDAGRIVGLFGPNGAGKSTLLGVLATLVRPSSGRVQFGESAPDGEALRRCIGVLGHDLFLYADLSARENLEFFGRLYGLDDLRRRVSDALEAARLADRAGDRVGTFSRGLRQRLALERALLHAPRLVLLDEPFTGLDDASTELLVARLRALRDRGAVVVMATHDFESAGDLVDDAVCLREGRLIRVAAGPAPLRERYRRTLETARS